MDINLYDNPDDINDNIIISPLHLFLQEVELAVKINSGIWGAKYYVDLERFVFNQRINAQTITNEINIFISENCVGAMTFPFQVETQIIKVEKKDLILIIFTVFDKENNRDFIQKFTVSV